MPARSTTRPLVVVADPDVGCAALVVRQLDWAGYAVLTTGSDADARRLVEERRPDALLVEAKLQDGNGYALVRDLREQPKNKAMPILMISARAGKLDRDFAYTVGANEYIKQPFPCAALIARLAILAPAEPAIRPRTRPLAPSLAAAL